MLFCCWFIRVCTCNERFNVLFFVAFLPFDGAGMKRNSDGETGPAPKRHRPMGDTELRLLVYSKVPDSYCNDFSPRPTPPWLCPELIIDPFDSCFFPTHLHCAPLAAGAPCCRAALTSHQKAAHIVAQQKVERRRDPFRRFVSCPFCEPVRAFCCRCCDGADAHLIILSPTTRPPPTSHLFSCLSISLVQLLRTKLIPFCPSAHEQFSTCFSSAFFSRLLVPLSAREEATFPSCGLR